MVWGGRRISKCIVNISTSCSRGQHGPYFAKCWALVRKKMKSKALDRCACVCSSAQSLSRVCLFATPWTIAHWTPHPWYFSDKNTRVSCHFLLQGIFRTQGSNPRLLHLLHWPADSLPLATWEAHITCNSAFNYCLWYLHMVSCIGILLPKRTKKIGYKESTDRFLTPLGQTSIR